MKKLIVFVPQEYAEAVKNALFCAGAGAYKHYSHCCFETHGVGQYKPLECAQPFLGQQGRLERTKELKIEMLCDDGLVEAALEKMKEAHPYESPAYEVSALEYWGT